MRRADTTVTYFRRRIPRDILDKVRGRTIRVPVGDRFVEKTISAKAEDIVFSLATRDPTEAKARAAVALAHLDQQWAALRNGPKKLTKREAVALSGEVYRAWMEAAGDDPGDPEVWQRITGANIDAMTGDYGKSFMMIGDLAKRRQAMEERFGPFADWLLRKHALEVDGRSRALLVAEVARAMMQMTRQLERHAGGDFRPDPDADRFPEVDLGREEPEAPKGVTFDRLIEGRWKEAEAGGGSRRTLSAWRTTFKQFADALGHDDAARVTRADVVAFKDRRVAEGASLKTVKDSDLAALKSVLGWAASNGHIPSNPAEGVTVKIGRSARRDRGRERGFTDDEAVSILRHALQHAPGAREKPKTAAAQRWVPWLLAFSGARVGEVAQLRKEDVFEKAGRWVMRITPDAGTVKTGETRLVPLHFQVISLGFLDFVRTSESGHLFVTPPDPSDPEGALRGLTNRLRVALKPVVPADVEQPFHAWRHRFNTKARELGCDEGLTRALVGHAARDVHDRYGDATITGLARVVDAFPDFEVG